MHLFTLAVLSSVLLAADVPPPEESTVKEVTPLQGRWEMVRAVQSGQDATKDWVGVVWAFDGDKEVFCRGDEVMGRGTFRVESGSRLNKVDFHSSRGDLVLGIYRLRGGQLEVAVSSDGDRPSEFKSEEGSSIFLTTLGRVKK